LEIFHPMPKFILLFCFLTFFVVDDLKASEKDGKIQDLVKDLSHDDHDRREAASAAFSKMGKAAIKPLKKVALEAELEAAFRALQVLAFYFYNEDKQLSDLAKKAIEVISEDNADLYHDTVQILRAPAKNWFKKMRAILDTRNQSLVLRNRLVDDEGLKTIQYFPELKILEIENANITNKGLWILKKLKNLQILKVKNCTISDEGLSYMMHLKNMEELDLSNTQISDKGMEVLASLTNLKELTLTECKISDKGLLALKSLKKLETLDLRKTEITEAGLKTLISFEELRSIDLRGSKVKGRTFALELIETIKRDTGEIENNEILLLATIYRCADAKTNEMIFDALYEIFDKDPLDKKGLRELLKDMALIWVNQMDRTMRRRKGNLIKKFVTVDFRVAEVNDKGLRHLRFLPNIYVLRLTGDVQITDEGLEVLKYLKNLRNLHITIKNISDEGLKHATGLSELTQIFLDSTQFSDAGLKHFKNMKKLTSLHVRKTKVTEAGAREFKKNGSSRLRVHR
jgi:Leucine-rich repeat (LRR) protein